MTSPRLRMAFVPLGGCAPLAVRRAAPRLAAGQPVRRSVAAAQPHRRAARHTPVASAAEPGDRTPDGDEVVVASAASGNVAEEEDTRSEKQKEIDRLKAAEKYVLAKASGKCWFDNVPCMKVLAKGVPHVMWLSTDHSFLRFSAVFVQPLVVIVLLALFSVSPSHHSLSSLIYPVCLPSLLRLPPATTHFPPRQVH